MGNTRIFSYTEVTDKLGYTFKNEMLLAQAFISEAFAKAEDEPASQNILVQYGKLGYDLYLGYLHNKEDNTFNSDDYLIHKLSYIKKQHLNDPLNDNSFLFPIYLDIPPYVLKCMPDEMNDSDSFAIYCNNLLYAIIGAVVIDSDWNSKAIFHICHTLYNVLLQTDNYGLLLEKLCEGHNISLTYKEASQIKYNDVMDQQWKCSALVNDKEIEVVSNSPITAKMKLACNIYHDLYPIVLEELCDLPDKEHAISQLEKLEDACLIDGVEFEYNQMTEDGLKKYHCRCTIENPIMEENTFAESKALAKKEAAYNILWKLFNSPDKLHFTDEID